jgi:heat shock protein HslJ
MFNFNPAKEFVVIVISLLLMISVSGCTAGPSGTDSTPMNKNQSLTGTAWWVEDIDNKGVIDMSHTTIEFTDDGEVAGDTGCNRYFGSVEIVAMDVKFGPLAGTRKACGVALMDQESRFFQAMGDVRRWEIAETGLLHLRDKAGTSLLRASKIDQ